MNCETLKIMIDSGAQLIDVRTPREYGAVRVAGAVNIPLEALTNIMTMFEKDTKLLLYCRSGARSGAAANFLLERGYDVTNIGGIFPFVGCLENQ